jgi:hypothetical protein
MYWVVPCEAAWTDLGLGLSEVLSLSHNGEGGPIVGVGIFVAKLLGGFGGGCSLIFAILESAVEGSHEFVGAGVVDVPKGQEQARRSAFKCIW